VQGGVLDSVDKAQDQEITIAAWQTEETGVPHRCVVRCDGWIQQRIGNLAQNLTETGFPCGVLRVDYSIGGYQRSVMVEAVNQSALVVWAETIEVSKVWRRDRINTLSNWFETVKGGGEGNPWPGLCISQRVGTAISLDDRGGDTGEADARSWDIIPFTNIDPPDPQPFIFEIPAGARALRLLNGTDDSGGLVPFSDFLTTIAWINNPNLLSAPALGQSAVYQDKVPTDTCALEVPPNATHLLLAYTVDTLETEMAMPFIIEWVLAPAYK
jgi:hypothetical protein